MGWITLEERATGRVLGPLDLAPRALRLRAHGGLRLARCEGAASRASRDDAGASWEIDAAGPFSMVFDGAAVGEVMVRVDAVDAAPEPAPPGPTEHVDASREAAPERVGEGATTDVGPAWRPREVALRWLTDTARAARVEALARQVAEHRAAVSTIVSLTSEGPGTTAEVAEVARRIVALTREQGLPPSWIGDVRAARAQREIFESTLARSRGKGVARVEPSAAPADELREWMHESVKRAPECHAARPEEPDEALAEVVREMGFVVEALSEVERAVRAVAADESHRADVRAALIARDAIRALGHRS